MVEGKITDREIGIKTHTSDSPNTKKVIIWSIVVVFACLLIWVSMWTYKRHQIASAVSELRVVANVTIKIIPPGWCEWFADKDWLSNAQKEWLFGDITVIEAYPGFDDDHVRLLKYTPTLKYLSLYGCYKISDEGLKPLENLIVLKRLDLVSCRIAKTALNSIEKLTTLEEMYLSPSNKITDLTFLEKLVKLKKLKLIDCRHVTDSGFKYIENLAALEFLMICFNNNITDASLKTIEKLATLEVLVLQRCDKLTDIGVESLQRALPNCKIQ